MKSMTGYGRGEAVLYNRRFTVEIKSVNHRYNDINIKLPRMLFSFEDRIKSLLAKEISRGKTDVYIHLDSFSADDIKININEALADAYVKTISGLRGKYDLCDDLSLSLLVKYPDIISVEKRTDDDENLNQMWETLQLALAAALSQFMGMRSAEGEALKRDLLVKRDVVSSLVSMIKERAPIIARDYEQRLRTKVEEAMANVNYDEARLIQEVTIFADRSCIDEELTRLESHLSQMGSIVEETETIGKKLDFLVQEINREVNTIGSKSNDIEITKIAIQLKNEVEKIREQVQNIE